MDYMKKYDKNPFEDSYWNIPETKQGTVGIVGGNSQMFRSSIAVAEYLMGKYPLKEARLILPNALEGKLPPLDNLTFLHSTESGSFADGEEMVAAMDANDFNLLIGDFSRNNITAKAVAGASQSSAKPTLLTRDTVDLIAAPGAEKTLMNENLIVMASMAQLQKLFRAVYYPKVLLLTQPLLQVADAIHKFTLSYPVSIITLHDGQILIAKNGEVAVVPLGKSGYSPLTFWSGELAAKIVALNLYNPNNFVTASVAAVFAK